MLRDISYYGAEAVFFERWRRRRQMKLRSNSHGCEFKRHLYPGFSFTPIQSPDVYKHILKDNQRL